MQSRGYHIFSSAVVILGLLLFNKQLELLSGMIIRSEYQYHLYRALMGFWLVIAGFLLIYHGPRTWGVTTDWPLLLIHGIPAIIFTLLPFFVSVLNMPLPVILSSASQRMAVEAVGPFWLGVAIAKAYYRS